MISPAFKINMIQIVIAIDSRDELLDGSRLGGDLRVIRTVFDLSCPEIKC